MILGSKIENGKKIYSLEMTEDEFIRAQNGEAVQRRVEWKDGQGSWIVTFKKKIT